MSIVIVPDYLHEAITKAVNEAAERAKIPEEKRPDAKRMAYQTILKYFNEHGEIPSFDFRATP